MNKKKELNMFLYEKPKIKRNERNASVFFLNKIRINK